MAARCLSPFRVLSLRTGGARVGEIAGADLEVHQKLRELETEYYRRTVASTEEEVGKRNDEMAELHKQMASIESAIQKGEALGDMSEAETRDYLQSQREAQSKSIARLEKKRAVNEEAMSTARKKHDAWLASVADFSAGGDHVVPVLPIGDSVLEPFWPMGLGSNRGFHTALDAVWAVHTIATQGLEAGLLESVFWYNLVMQSIWMPNLIQSDSVWSADPATRYTNAAVEAMKAIYTNPASKRLFRGEAAIPPRLRDASAPPWSC